MDSMRTFDPHDDSFIAKNLREEEWYVYQKSSRVLSMATVIKETLDKGMVACVKHSVLDEVGLDVAMQAAIPACLIQSQSHGHWAGLALCMFTHGMMAHFNSEGIYEYFYSGTGVTRFYKSPHDQEPMYWSNIEWEIAPARNYYIPVRKRTKNEVKATRAAGNRQNDSVITVSRRGAEKRDEPAQGCLFDLH